MALNAQSGIQVRMAVESADGCPVAAATNNETSVQSVTWSAAPAGKVVEEFDLEGDADADALPADAETVFAADERRRIRFERDNAACICDRIENHGTPVTEVTASHGTLRLTFHATDVETIRGVVDDLSETFDSVRIDRLAHSGREDTEDLVLVDRSHLTDRQREVLETALAMGYFDRPRDANAGDVATALDIAPSTFAEHLASAQAKVLESVLAESA
jgi:predicted DNA binding protein